MTVQLGADAPASASEQLRVGGGLYAVRPVPDDFAQQAQRRSISGLKKYYSTGWSVITRWFEESGAERLNESKMPVPAEFVRLAGAMHQQALAAHYGVASSTIRIWLDKLDIKAAPRPDRPSRRLMPPDDFQEVARTKAQGQLEQHYKVSESVIKRWCKETGVRPMLSPYYRRNGNRASIATSGVDGSVAAQAAHYLRSRSRYIVYKCEVLDAAQRAKLPNKGKDHWYVNGRGAMPAPQMIAFAEAKGFDSGAWARI